MKSIIEFFFEHYNTLFQKRNIQKVCLGFLEYLIEKQHVLRVGSTHDPERRHADYCHKEPEKYNQHWMLYADTQNMKRQETRLLQKCQESGTCPLNYQHVSNQSEDKGYVYVFM